MDLVFNVIGGLIGLALNVGIVAFVAVRLLDIRFTVVRAVIVGVIAQGAVQVLLLPALLGDLGEYDPESLTPGEITALLLLVGFGFACGPLFAMIMLVVWEALIPIGAVPPIRTWIRSLRDRVGRTRRYVRILRIVSKYRLTGIVRGRGDLSRTREAELAGSLRKALDEAGVTFVKLGQVLATRRDLLPAAYVEELSKLQDRASPLPFEQVRAVIERSAGARESSVFRDLDPEPLAAASIAQVHTATLLSGEAVVVKVKRPGVDAVTERDLDIIGRLADMIERSTDWGKSVGVRRLAEGFAEALREELDFRIESANLSQARAAAAARGSDVRIPAPFPDLSDRDLLVMDRLQGASLSQVARDADPGGPDAAATARRLTRELLDQIMIDGVFHADPHPGNILLLDDQCLGFIDYGSVGRIDRRMREALQHLLFALENQDVYALADGLLEVTSRPEGLNQVEFERALGSFMARFFNQAAQPDLRMFNELFRIVMKFHLAVPGELAAVFRAMGTIEGTATALDPGFDLVEQAKSYGDQYAGKYLRSGALKERVTSDLVAALPTAKRLVRRVDRLAGAAEDGRLSIGVRLFADPRERHTVTMWLNQILLTVLAATTGIMAVLLIGVQGGPELTADITLYDFIGYALLFIASVMALRVLVGIFAVNRRQDLGY